MHGAGNDYIYVNGFSENTDNISEEILSVFSENPFT